MSKIRQLSSDLANQIAAGEVVERPASVVKELVENALDAGATKVRVEIEQGGLQRIRVSDDGSGMDPEDASLCLLRHATSKIDRVEDLSSLRTFGFRGEALPSMASVSKLVLITRDRSQSEGTEVQIDGGGTPRVKPAGCAVGTSIDVRDLFFNVPARKKFLKSTATESAHVGDVVTTASLARPDVSFTLTRDGRVAREMLRVTTRAERVAQVMGFGDDRVAHGQGERGPLQIEAYLLAPEKARAGATGLHLFVNGRPVRDRMLSRAVAQSFGSVLEAGRFPVGVVYLELPPEMVDVNVHPQKAEVRFTDARALCDALTRELYGVTSQAFAIPALGPPTRPWLPPPAASRAAAYPIREFTPREHGYAGAPERLPHPNPPPEGEGAETSISELTPAVSAPGVGGSEAPGGLGWGGAAGNAAWTATPVEADSLFANRPPLRFLAQVRKTFLLCEGVDGLYIVDQHAAAERVTFDRLRKAFAARDVAMQRLLVPEVVELSPVEVAALEERPEDVAAVGLEVRAVGTNAVAVHAVPKLLVRANPERLVRDLVAELTRQANRPFGGAADLVLATMACHASVRAGDTLSPEEATALLASLEGIDFSGHCPHGRPIVMHLTFAELERRVGR
ncbi:DNA mismatch repair endonuclease MutL [Pendulispora rubella]|uniref:DNA mismatch repair protein MutL n=1 Tax=Pendulispora rubella TaxID=2741070 RepID=A0ABZ2KY39_9BACT